MNDTQTSAKDPAVRPTDPAMAASDPAMFAPMTTGENQILSPAPDVGLVRAAGRLPRAVRAVEGNQRGPGRPQRRMADWLAGRARARGRAMTLSISTPNPARGSAPTSAREPISAATG